MYCKLGVSSWDRPLRGRGALRSRYLEAAGVAVRVETEAALAARLAACAPYNVLVPEEVDAGRFLPLLAMHWISRSAGSSRFSCVRAF